MSRRVLVAGFMHETNTFSVLATDLAAFAARTFLEDEAVVEGLRGTRTEIGGYLEACERNGWEVVTPVYANATPSGRVTRAAFETVAGTLVECARRAGPFDAVLLALHGAMATEHLDDGEGALLGRLRATLGPGPLIATTLDLHANVSDAMAAHADVIVSYRTYPHVDQAEAAQRAADIVQAALAGGPRPRTVVARGAMIEGADDGRTGVAGPMAELLAEADRIETRPGVLAVSVNAGFGWADVSDAGPSAVVVGTDEAAALRSHAEGLVERIWEGRHRTTLRAATVAEAVAAVREASGERPVVLADFADNPGAGGYGDATGLLAGLLDAHVENAAFATLFDPESARACHAAGPGAEVSLALGGKTDPRLGAPLAVTGTVRALTDGRFTLRGPMLAGSTVDMGPSAALRVGGVDIVVASARYQAYDEMFFVHAGIEPCERRALAVKSMQHFRAAFEPLAERVVVVDEGGGLATRDLRHLPYQRVRRPVFPLDLE